ATFSCLWQLAGREPDLRLRNALLFMLNSNSLGYTLLNRYSPKRFSHVNRFFSGILYLSSIVAETSYRYSYGGKAERPTKAFRQLELVANPGHAITTQSSTSLQQIPDISIDYVFVDPPFGRNIPYSELNQIWESWLRVFTS